MPRREIKFVHPNFTFFGFFNKEELIEGNIYRFSSGNEYIYKDGVMTLHKETEEESLADYLNKNRHRLTQPKLKKERPKRPQYSGKKNAWRNKT